MTLDEVIALIKNCASRMDALYGKTVFDEWAVVSLVEGRARVLSYQGPRHDDFLKNFTKDLGSLRTELASGSYGPGDFEFSRHGVGTGFESFLVLGQGLYLICNNTAASMDNIAKDPRWLSAQVPFVELAEKIRPNPLAGSGDTQHFTR